MNLMPMLPYAIGTLIVGVLTIYARDRDEAGSYIVVTASWLLWCGCIAFLWAIGHPDYEPWYAGILIDALAAYFLYRHPSNKVKATIAAIFCLQITIHMAFGGLKLSHIPANGDVYADYLSITGWLELLLVGGWAGGHTGHRMYRFWRMVSASRRSAHSRDLGAS